MSMEPPRQPRDDAEWHDWEHERLEDVRGDGDADWRTSLAQAATWIAFFALIAFWVWVKYGD